MRIRIIGAGFSGLTTAYFANQIGFDVEVFEAKDEVGGLIHTQSNTLGISETAANGLLNSSLVEQLFKDIGITMISMKKEARNRYIYTKGKPKRWPLGLKDSLAFASRGILSSVTMKKKWKPKNGETLKEWGYRTIGAGASEKILFPALQGIYAGQPHELSASLIMGRFFSGQKRQYKPLTKIRGTVSAPGGMGELLKALEKYLVSRGVRFKKGQSFKFSENDRGQGSVLIIATSAKQAAELLKGHEVSETLNQVDLLPVVSVTAWYDLEASKIKGFGCLFPRNQNVRALGVLFNNQIFNGRSQYQSETWIFGGASDRAIIDFTDEEILEQVAQDRKLLQKVDQAPLGYRITRWPQAIPHYTVGLENILRNRLYREVAFQPVLDNVYFTGNYFGSLGLSKILERSKALVDQLIAGQFNR